MVSRQVLVGTTGVPLQETVTFDIPQRGADQRTAGLAAFFFQSLGGIGASGLGTRGTNRMSWPPKVLEGTGEF